MLPVWTNRKIQQRFSVNQNGDFSKGWECISAAPEEDKSSSLFICLHLSPTHPCKDECVRRLVLILRPSCLTPLHPTTACAHFYKSNILTGQSAQSWYSPTGGSDLAPTPEALQLGWYHWSAGVSGPSTQPGWTFWMLEVLFLFVCFSV